MMKNRRKPASLKKSINHFSEGSESSARLPWDYSPPTLKVQGAEEYHMIFQENVNLTISLKVTEFSRKQATLLAGQALYQVSEEGLSLGDWMVLEFLYNYLIGSKREPLEMKNFKELELTLLLKVVLLSGTFMNLEEKVQLPEDIKSLLTASRWVPNRRTYFSRKVAFQLNKFLYVRIVPIDNFIDRSKGTIPYSSYCKGYGESSRMGRRQKTRFSAELDGTQPDILREQALRLDLFNIQTVMSANLLEIKYKNRKK